MQTQTQVSDYFKKKRGRPKGSVNQSKRALAAALVPVKLQIDRVEEACERDWVEWIEWNRDELCVRSASWSAAFAFLQSVRDLPGVPSRRVVDACEKRFKAEYGRAMNCLKRPGLLVSLHYA